MSFVDLGHALAVVLLRAGGGGGGCAGYPVAALQRQLAAGYLFVAGWVSAVLKGRRLGRTANRPVRARVYFPIHHDAMECHVRPRIPARSRAPATTRAPRRLCRQTASTAI